MHFIELQASGSLPHIPPHRIHSLLRNILGFAFKRIFLAKYLGSFRNRARNRLGVSAPVCLDIGKIQLSDLVLRKKILHRSEWQKTLRPFALGCAFIEDHLLGLYRHITPMLNPVHYRHHEHWSPEDWIANIYIIVL